MNKLRTNKDKIVEMAILGEIAPFTSSSNPYIISPCGTPKIRPGVGGITYNFKIGDSAVDLVGDHIEPCVSVSASPGKPDSPENLGFTLLACIGNQARVVSGDAKGSLGIVTGKHGGIEHVMIDFDNSVIDKLSIGDKIQIRARGLGLKLLDFNDIKVTNLDPDLLEKIAFPSNDGKLKVLVTNIIPSKIMGSGLGRMQVERGDYDIQMFDEKSVEEYNLNKIRFGDIIAITDADTMFGRIYKEGSISIGVVVHSASSIAGHGPGLTTIFSCNKKDIVLDVNENANIGYLLKIGKFR